MKPEELDQLIETLTGIRAGKQWQYKRPANPKWEDPQAGACPNLIMSWGNSIRLNPAPDPYAELKAAHAAGKTLQTNEGRMWGSADRWTDWTNPTPPLFGNPPEFYRIKPDPVPLCKDDIPPMAVLRNLRFYPELAWVNITRVNFSGVVADGTSYGYDRLAITGWEILRPGQDWQPCHKDSP